MPKIIETRSGSTEMSGNMLMITELVSGSMETSDKLSKVTQL